MSSSTSPMDPMGQRATKAWSVYSKGNSQRGYAMAKELLREPDVSVTDQVCMHVILTSDAFEGPHHAREAVRILTEQKAKSGLPAQYEQILDNFKQLPVLAQAIHDELNETVNELLASGMTMNQVQQYHAARTQHNDMMLKAKEVEERKKASGQKAAKKKNGSSSETPPATDFPNLKANPKTEGLPDVEKLSIKPTNSKEDN
ncbi:hypothetical protein FHETE_9881 [Fusarium heterosporum]|uniref:Uncharacterized protein n=1 Tax=Fusarium heterosporum TaxID=42747 RepID=A0A8H5WDH4_FUSHE|nr:hypothetical protein FHETE_9881 [Fusarium heterosporum]